jgi:outer membrane protein assembly factor BamB
VTVEQIDRLVAGPAYNYIDAAYSNSDWPTYRCDGQRSGATSKPVAAAGLEIDWQFQLKTQPSALTIEDGKLFVADKQAHTVYCIDATTGAKLWDYITTARVDSPPTYHKGLVIFGSMDGWVYCLKADTGELSWRFKGLPDEMMCAFGQLESPWPVNGSVLVKNDIAYISAGRVSFLDGGIFLFALDPQTGAVLHRNSVYGPFEADGFPHDAGEGFKSDVLVSDGTNICIRHKTFDSTLNVLPYATAGDHVIATGGFLNLAPQHRNYWKYASDYGSKNKVTDCADILLVDGSDVYLFNGMPVARHSYFDPRTRGYELSKIGGWSANVPMTTKAMIMAGNNIFIAGNPVEDMLIYDYNDRIEEVGVYTDTYKGYLGGAVWAVSKTDGTKLAEYTFGAPIVWDGLAAANGRIYAALENGKIISMVATNNPPSVNAGSDQTIYPMASAVLDATVTDDGKPKVDPNDPNSAPIGITCSWAKLAGPGDVNFADPNIEDTSASFSESGSYTLRMTADDGGAFFYDDIVVTVRKPADLDGDDDTDINDLDLMLARWLDSDCNNDNQWCFGADQAGKGSVDLESLAVISLNWPIVPDVPEPNLAGCVMKMDAGVGVTADASDKVSAWADEINSNDATQSNDSNRPTLIASAINGYPAISFDGTGQHLDVANDPLINSETLGYTAKTLTVVFKTSTDVTSRQIIWEQGGSGNGLNFYIDAGSAYINGVSAWGPTGLNAPVLANTAYVATMIVDSDANDFLGFLNGQSAGVFSPIEILQKQAGGCAFGHTEGKAKFHDGNATDPAPLNGMIAEFYEYNTVLSPAERAILENYLMAKYGITP